MLDEPIRVEMKTNLWSCHWFGPAQTKPSSPVAETFGPVFILRATKSESGEEEDGGREEEEELILTDEEMNKLGAKLLKAELMGNKVSSF